MDAVAKTRQVTHEMALVHHPADNPSSYASQLKDENTAPPNLPPSHFLFIGLAPSLDFDIDFAPETVSGYQPSAISEISFTPPKTPYTSSVTSCDSQKSASKHASTSPDSNEEAGQPNLQKPDPSLPIVSPRTCSKQPEPQIIIYSPKERSQRNSAQFSPARRSNALSKDKNPKIKIHQQRGGVQGVFAVFGADEKIRSRFTPQEKHETRVTRESGGACWRCRKCKQRCNAPRDPLQPCPRCAILPRHLLRQPCIRVDILDLKLHRRGSTLNNLLETWTTAKDQLNDVMQIAYPGQWVKPHVVSITQDQGIMFPVTIQTFIPENDTTSWRWRDSSLVERAMEMPPYYICDKEDATRNMQIAAFTGREAYINSNIQGANSISRKTFEAAFRYIECTNSTLVSNALTFWVATRFIEHPWRICIGDLPGFVPADEPGCPYNHITPVTPVMDTQIDDIALRALIIPLSEKILKEFDQLMKCKRYEKWFEIYLTTFIIMNNFEFIFADIIDYTSRHGMKASNNSGPSLSSGYVHACKTMLVYFHFACHGYGPLSLTWNTPPAPLELIPFDQQEYLQDIQKDISNQKDSIDQWRKGSMYQTPSFWCNQLLCEDWSSDIPQTEPIDGFTEQDFLTS